MEQCWEIGLKIFPVEQLPQNGLDPLPFFKNITRNDDLSSLVSVGCSPEY